MFKLNFTYKIFKYYLKWLIFLCAVNEYTWDVFWDTVYIVFVYIIGYIGRQGYE